LIVTAVPRGAADGVTLVIVGGGVTVKVRPLLGVVPPARTTRGPVLAPCGTTTLMVESLQLVTGAVLVLKVTVPCAEPKFVPVRVTAAPAGPDTGVADVMLGGGGSGAVRVES
jgi:hypothetical protein